MMNRVARANSLQQFSLASAMLISLFLPNAAEAQVPHLIRYQGQAVDSKGVPLEGPYMLIFRLYDAETGGTKLWEETQANVPLKNGYFSVLLGQVTPMTSMDWSKPCWLSVQVNTQPELAPRQQITSVPLAMRAETAEVVKTSGLTDDTNQLVPSGAIILWEGASCPAGYTRLSTYDDRFLVASSTAGTTGGSNTHDHGGATGSYTLTVADIPAHTHSTPAHTHTLSARNSGRGGTVVLSPLAVTSPIDTIQSGNPPGTAEGGGISGATGGDGGHTHTIAPADSRPAFRTVLLCKKD